MLVRRHVDYYAAKTVAVATIDWRNQHIEPDGRGDRKRRAR